MINVIMVCIMWWLCEFVEVKINCLLLLYFDKV